MGFFKEHERLITLSKDLHEKQQIESGINRYLIPVSTVESFIENLEQETKRNDRVVILVTSTMCDIFKHHLGELAQGINALVELGKVQVVEIGIGNLVKEKVFKNALSFSDVLSFVEYCREADRDTYIQSIEKDEDKNKQEEGRILRELIVERDAAKDKIKQLERTILQEKEKVKQVEGHYLDLKTKVDNIYLVDIESLKRQLEEIKEERDELERKYKLEKSKVKDYQDESDKYRSENKSLQLDYDSLKQVLEDRKEQIRGLQGQIKVLKADIDKAEKEKLDILKSKVDAETYVQLSQTLDDTRRELRELQEKYHELEKELRKKDFIIKDQEQEIDELRTGELEITSNGITNVLDTFHFKATNVYYVKVITPLPYLTSALKGLYAEIKKREQGRTHICVICNDEGLNSKIFKDFELYGTLGDVQSKHEFILLHPSRRMFTGAEKFDKSVKAIMVIDYIKSSDYYLSTDGLERVITVCRHSSMMHSLGLKGTVVSLDSQSLLDIKHDPRIEKAQTKVIQQQLIDMKISEWLKRLNLTM